MNYLECYTISREMIFAIANDYPKSRRVIRRFALIMALKRKLAAHREEVRKVRHAAPARRGRPCPPWPPLPSVAAPAAAVAAPAAAVAAPAAAVAAPVATAPATVPLAPLAPLAAALAAPARLSIGRRQRDVGWPA